MELYVSPATGCTYLQPRLAQLRDSFPAVNRLGGSLAALPRGSDRNIHSLQENRLELSLRRHADRGLIPEATLLWCWSTEMFQATLTSNERRGSAPILDPLRTRSSISK